MTAILTVPRADKFPTCRESLVSDNYDTLWCASYRSETNEGATALDKVTYTYGPDVGWWLMLGAIVASMISTSGVFATHR